MPFHFTVCRLKLQCLPIIKLIMNIIINHSVTENPQEDDEVHCFCFQPRLDDRYCALFVVNHSKQLALISLRQRAMCFTQYILLWCNIIDCLNQVKLLISTVNVIIDLKLIVFSFMIQCDGCDTWFHGSCVRVIEDEAKLLNNYYCECNAPYKHCFIIIIIIN